MLRYGRGSGPIYYLWLCLSLWFAKESATERTHIEAQVRRVQDADRHRCITAHWSRRSCPHPAAQKTQVSSTCIALSLPTAVGSPRSGGQLRIRKRITTASSSRNFVDGRARPPRSRRPTDAAACHRPTHAGRRPGLGAARGRGPRHRDGAAAARAQGRRGGGRGDLPAGRERPVARLAQEPARLGS